MLNVSSNGEIRLTRGDTARLTVDIMDDEGLPYVLQEKDTLTLTVKKDYEDTTPAIEKEIEGNNMFHIEPADTAGLPFGSYKYDVQLKTEDGDVYTVIADKIFTILKEVTV
jgi:hypothetical protein